MIATGCGKGKGDGDGWKNGICKNIEGGERGGRDSTCMISLRTLGTSEKKKRAKTPATPPKDAAVIPLFWGER